MSIFKVPLDLVQCIVFPMLTLKDIGVLSAVCADWRKYILEKYAKELCTKVGAVDLVLQAGLNPLELLDSWQGGRQLLSCGESHGAMINKESKVLVWKENAQRCPVVLPFAVRAQSVSCGYGHVTILSSDGKIYSCGRNDHGQLGVGDKVDRSLLQQMRINDAAKDVKAGDGFTVILTRKGKLFSTGQLDIANSTNVNEVTLPTEVNINLLPKEQASHIAAGGKHILVLTTKNRLLSAGFLDPNLLGRPVEAPGANRELNQVIFAHRPDCDIVQVSAGLSHSLVLFGNGQVFAFGRSPSGELGLPHFMDALSAQPIPNLPLAISVSAGIHHSLILTAEKNKIVAFGMGALGQLGYRMSFWSSTYPRYSPLPMEERKRIKFIAAGNGFSACLSSDSNDLFACGKASMCAGAGNGARSGNAIALFSRVPEEV